MKKKSKVIISVSILLILLTIATFYRIKQVNAESGKRPAQIPNVSIGKVSRADMIQSESLTGDILPIQQANIYSRVSGNIEKIFFNIGDFV